MIIHTRRFILTDFSECDREAFVEYQMDSRYRRLYGLDNQCEQKAHDLFELFLSWQSDQPRQRFQLGMFEQITGRLCGSAGLRRKLGEDESTLALGSEHRRYAHDIKIRFLSEQCNGEAIIRICPFAVATSGVCIDLKPSWNGVCLPWSVS